MLIYIIVMGWTLIVYGSIAYFIIKKKEYGLISGFSNRPKEEQEYLIQNGFIEKLGKVLLYSFFMLVIAAVLPIFHIPYGVEIGWGLFIIFTFGGLLYLQKFEFPTKRKKYRWLYGIIAILTIGLIIGVSFAGNQDNEILIENNTFIISGMYGIEWSLERIENVELLKKLPEVVMKTNGFSSGNSRKGKFKLEEPYGFGRLFVTGDKGPFLYIRVNDDYVILNRPTEQETIEFYERIMDEL